MKLPITPAIFAIISNGFHSLASSLSTPQNNMTAAPSNCPCGVKGSKTGGGRIVGGEDAEPHEYPWQVNRETRKIKERGEPANPLRVLGRMIFR